MTVAKIFWLLNRGLLPRAVVVLVLAAVGFAAQGRAEDSEAERSFAAAAKLFQGGWFEQANVEFAAFLNKFSKSTNASQAVLLQAQSRFQLQDFSGAIELLEGHLSAAASEKDQFWSWLGQAHL